MILCIGTTPAVQRVMVFRKLAVDHVNRARLTLEGAAGKSINVAKVLKALGEDPMATGFLGGDRGEFLRGVLEGKGIRADFVAVSERTRQCLTVIDEATGTQTELIEESARVKRADYRELMQIVRGRLNPESKMPARSAGKVPENHPLRGERVGVKGNWGRRTRGTPSAVIMSGTITPGGPVGFYFECTRMARAAGALAVVDAQGAPLVEALKARPSLVKPNHAELTATFGNDLKNERAVQGAMRQLRDHGAERVVVTAGRKPALAYDGRTFWKISNPAIKPVNPIGSGDAFTAGLVWRLLRGEDLGEACRWAAATGAANALTLMAGEVERNDVVRLARDVKIEKLT